MRPHASRSVRRFFRANHQPLSAFVEFGDARLFELGSALFEAARANRPRSIEHLLAQLPVEQRSTIIEFKHPHQLESTPLVIATIHANVEAVRTLLAFGANPSSANQMQWTPLHFAVSNATAAHVEIARMLLRSPGVQVDACSGLGMTPLHIAARSGHSELITLLLEHNADTQKQCRDNLTPRDHALRSGSAVVARFDLLVAEHARRRDNRMLLCALRRSPDVWIAALPLSVFQHVGAMVCHGEFAYDSDHVSGGNADGSCGSEFTADEAMTEPRTSTALSSGAPPLSARSSSSSSSSRCRRWSLRRADS